MKKTELVPLSPIDLPRITSQVNLPFNIDQYVGLNLALLTHLLGVAGIKYITIKVDNQGETSDIVPTIVAMDDQGTALAGKAGKKRISTFSENNEGIEDPGSLTYSQVLWSHLFVTINQKEIEQRIRHETEYSVRDVEIWVQEIDQILKQAIINAGIENLLKTLRVEDAFMAIGLYFFDLLHVVEYTTGKKELNTENLVIDVTDILWNGVLFSAMVKLLTALKRKYLQGYNREARFSFFVGFEIDRFIYLWFLTKMNNLVQPLEQTR